MRNKSGGQLERVHRRSYEIMIDFRWATQMAINIRLHAMIFFVCVHFDKSDNVTRKRFANLALANSMHSQQKCDGMAIVYKSVEPIRINGNKSGIDDNKSSINDNKSESFRFKLSM